MGARKKLATLDALNQVLLAQDALDAAAERYVDTLRSPGATPAALRVWRAALHRYALMFGATMRIRLGP